MSNLISKVLRYKTWLFAAFVVIAIMGLAAFIYNGDPQRFKDEIVMSMLSTLITILLLQLLFQVFTNLEFKQTVEEKIMDSLSGDRKIIDKYRDESIARIINNCFPPLLGDFLSEKFIENVVEKQIRNASYRKDYDYNVTIETADGGGNYTVEQDIAYRKCIKRRGRQAPAFARFCFSFGGDPFEAYNDDNSIIFFREELTDRGFIEELIANGQSPRLIEMLGFSISIETGGRMKPVAAPEMNASIVDGKGLMIEVPIRREHITENTDEDTFEYMAEMKCRYPAGKLNHFYCAFPEPTANPKFSITFPDTDIALVEQVRFLSLDDYHIKTHKHRKELISRRPKESDVIFPHSGVVFFWKDRA